MDRWRDADPPDRSALPAGPAPAGSPPYPGAKRPRSAGVNDSVPANGGVSDKDSDSHPHRRHAPPQRSKRAQVTRACHRCKRLQKGCSEQRPCRRCIEADLADSCCDPSPGPASASHAASRRLTPPLTMPPMLPPAQVLDHCANRFLTLLCPTIPILSQDYVLSLRLRAGTPDSTHENFGTLVAICAMVLLQVEEPAGFAFPGTVHENNLVYGRRLLEEANEAHRRVRQGPTPSFDYILLTFLIYACHAYLCHHSRAFYFLREATTLLLIFHPEDTPDLRTRALADRLFWVLLISERSHAIRYRRPVTLQVKADTPSPDASDPSLAGFRDLAALFRPLDTSFIALIDQEAEPSFPPSPSSFARIETAINRAVDHTADLRDTQKANLRVTQLWLRIILWQVRLRLGHLSDVTLTPGPGAPSSSSLTYLYPLEVAREATLSTRDLPISCLAVHGVGLTEKLFDIACSVVDVLARIPLIREEENGSGVKAQPEDDLRYLRRLITQLPGGAAVYLELLHKHAQLTLPGLVW